MTSTAPVIEQPPATAAAQSLLLRCPACASVLGSMDLVSLHHSGRFLCLVCNFAIAHNDGVWRALPPSRIEQIESSLSAYESVRKAEGRWSEQPDFYRALPWRDLTGKFAGQWKIRAASFSFLTRKILPTLAAQLGRSALRILDLGAGNCWMSYRLCNAGHTPVAVDISVSALDGLRAARHYSDPNGLRFACFQADMDRLPFGSQQFDLVVYNASLHYSADYAATLCEARRVLRPRGAVAIVDSPSYVGQRDGEAMMREKHAHFAQRYGTGHGDMNGLGYLTPRRIAELEQFGFRWTRYSPWYGLRWAMRPLVARLARRRTPSQFHIYLGVLAEDGQVAK